MKKLFHFLVLLAMLFGFANSGYNQVFVEETGTTFPVITDDMSWGDFNNDGYLDLILTGHPSYKTLVYKNNGDKTFTEVTATGIKQLSSSKADWVDYDNDNDLDVFVTGQSELNGWISRLYRNNGNNTFTEINSGFTGVNGGAFAWGDYNNDGYKDVVITGNNYAKLYSNDGDGTFTYESSISLAAIYFGDVEWADYDNDGDLDLLYAANIADGPSTSNGYTTKLYQNNGNNSFTEVTSLPFIQTGIYSSVNWGDYDNDGDLDVLACGETATDNTDVYKNNGNGTFSILASTGLEDVKRGSAEWGDYDNDGDLDIFLSGHQGVSTVLSKVYTNNGNDTFTELESLAGASNTQAQWGDYDNDNILDIAYQGNVVTVGDKIMLYENTRTTANSAPLAPTNLNASISNGDLILTWDKATDTETAQSGLSYNIYIYNETTSGYLVSPEAFEYNNAKNGQRLMPKRGSIQYNAAGYTIKNIDYGSYKWSVQAVDAGFRGGAFSAEQAFTYENLTVVSMHVSNGTILSSSAKMEYSLNSTDGINGTWLACNTGTTNVDFGEGGFDVWVRQTDYTANSRNLGTIAARPSAPTNLVTLNKTYASCIVTNVQEFKNKTNTLDWTVGNNFNKYIYPEDTLYVRVKGTASTLTSKVQVIGIFKPATPAFSINYTTEQSNEVATASIEISTSSEFYAGNTRLGDGANVALTPGTKLYFRVAGTDTSYQSEAQTLTISARPIAPSVSIDYMNIKTNETIATGVKYSYLSDFSDYKLGTGEKLDILTDTILYLRVEATASTFKSNITTLNIPARQAEPIYSIDYIKQSTNANLTSTTEYAYDAEFNTSFYGTYARLALTPGKDVYIRKKATTFAFASTILHLVVPAMPSGPLFTIDYLNELTNETVGDSISYSVNADMTNALYGVDKRLKVTPGTTLYFRSKASSKSFQSDVTQLAVPERNTTPKFTIDYVNETTLERIADSIEFDYSQQMLAATEGKNTKLALAPGKTCFFRTKATNSSFASAIQTLNVPLRPIPSLSVDYYRSLTNEVVNDNILYSTKADMSASAMGTGSKIKITPGIDLYYLQKAMLTSFRSDTIKLDVPNVPAAPAFGIDYLNQKTNSAIASNVIYSVNSTMTDSIVGANTAIKLTPGTDMFFQILPSNMGFGSAVQHLKVGAKPSPPIYSINFKTETTTEDVNSLVQYSSDPSFWYSVKGVSAPIPVIPGDDIYFRSLATDTSFISEVFTLEIPNRPLGTSISIDFLNEQTVEEIAGNVIISKEFDFAEFSHGKMAKIDITPTDTFYFKIAASDTSFESEYQKLIVPDRPELNVSIDYFSETTKEKIDSTIIYSMEISFENAIKGTNEKLKVEPGKTIYFKIKASDTTFASEVMELKVPGRPIKPEFSISYENETTNEIVLNKIEYTGNANFEISLKGANEKLELETGDTLFFRYVANTSSFSSEILNLIIPKRPEAPVIAIDYIKEQTVDEIKSTMFYATQANLSDKTLGLDAVLNLTPGIDLFFMNSYSDSTFQSEIMHLIVPERPDAPEYVSQSDIEDVFKWNVNNEITDVDLYEYTLDGGEVWNNCSSLNIEIGNIQLNAEKLRIRVKAAEENFSGLILSDLLGFTVQTGIEDLNENQIYVYPNPASNQITINTDCNIEAIEMYSSNGKLIANFMRLNSAKEIDISELNSGIYFLKLTAGENIFVKSFIKE